MIFNRKKSANLAKILTLCLSVLLLSFNLVLAGHAMVIQHPLHINKTAAAGNHHKAFLKSRAKFVKRVPVPANDATKKAARNLFPRLFKTLNYPAAMVPKTQGNVVMVFGVNEHKIGMIRFLTDPGKVFIKKILNILPGTSFSPNAKANAFYFINIHFEVPGNQQLKPEYLRKLSTLEQPPMPSRRPYYNLGTVNINNHR